MWGEAGVEFTSELVTHYPRLMRFDAEGDQHCLMFSHSNNDVLHTMKPAGGDEWSDPQVVALGRGGAIRTFTKHSLHGVRRRGPELVLMVGAEGGHVITLPA